MIHHSTLIMLLVAHCALLALPLVYLVHLVHLVVLVILALALLVGHISLATLEREILETTE